MKKLIILIFICSIFNLVTSDVPQVTQVLRQVIYHDRECESIYFEEHIVFGECYKGGSESKKYFLMDTDNDNSTYVRMEKYNDNDCQTTDSNTTCDFGCTVNGIYSHSFTIVSVTGDILKLGSDYDDNGNCDALYEESYMTDYCYVEDEKSNRLSRAGQLVYQTDYSDPSCSSFEEQRNYTLAECKEWQDDNHELFLLVAEGDLSSGETDGGVVNSINFVLLFTFLIVNSLFFLN